MATEDAELGQRAGPGAELLVAELARGFAYEGAGSLTDCLQRRCMLGLDADFGRRLAPVVADWLVRLGIRDKTQAAAELAAYNSFARRFTQYSAAIDRLEA
jgi:glycerol-3-phosphate dehydrogenase